MAKVAEEEVEYESDPEEEKRLLGLRRREAASDDEEGEGEGEQKGRMDRRAAVHSDESDGQGGAAEYDDEDEELEGEEDREEVYEDEEEDEVYEDDEDEDEIDGFEEMKEGSEERRGGAGGGVEVKEKEVEGRKLKEGVEVNDVENHAEDEEEEDEEGKKENEPFAVPTAGAFYMHDDRFRDNAGGRHRRTYGGRKLWESKDDKKWGHDKFEEMNLQERHYNQGRRGSKGNFRGRGAKNRGPDRGYARRNSSKTFSNGNNQNDAPKGGVRGRGPRKYEPTWKRSGQALPAQKKKPEKLLEKSSHANSGRVFTPTPNTESDQAPPARKHSSLSSASPPFYPSGSSNKDITLTQKRVVQGSTSRSTRTSVTDEGFSMRQAGALMRRKNIADSVAIDKLYIDDSVTSTAGKPLNSMRMEPSGSSLVNTIQSSQSRTQGRGAAISGQITSAPLQNQVSKASSAMQAHPVQRNPAQSRAQPSVEAPGQQLGQRSGSGSQASSPPKTVNSYESGDAETSSESSKSRGALVGKGKGSIQGSGRGSFLYGGAQVVGATGTMGVGHGDQNFPSPAFLPVMQFGGQHPGSIGVPAVGMAFPGYVAQPQLGLGNSEMTWLPVLAGAAGALGATYCSPYIAVDGTYHPRPSGQTTSASSSSKENNSTKSNNDWKPSQKPELANDEFGQRQKPRRYSEMDFKQPSTST